MEICSSTQWDKDTEYDKFVTKYFFKVSVFEINLKELHNAK